jgi:hypothetical protein
MQELMAAGQLVLVIDRCYTLNDVPDAMRYLEGGHARGKVVIALDAPDRPASDYATARISSNV